ncbi:stage II sporulation protein M [Bacillaceae bacterium]
MFRQLFKVIASNRQYVLISTALLVLGTVTGYFYAEKLEEAAAQLLRELNEIAREIGQRNSLAYAFWAIFKNNVLASFTMLGLGVFFGIYPVLSIFANGMILGFLLRKYQLAGIDPWDVLLFGILPHGAIELFAVVLATAFGLKYGAFSYRFLRGLFQAKERSRLKRDLALSFKQLPTVVVTIVIFLFLAALIETTVTPLLVHELIGNVQVDLFRLSE